MKLLANLRFMFLLAIASATIVGCSEDPIGGGSGKTSTSLSLAAGQDLVTSTTTVPIGGTFSVNLVATAGDDLMNTIQIFEDGTSISLTRIKYNDVDAVANPVLLLEGSKSSIDVFIDVVAHTEVATKTYRFSVADDAGDVQSVSVEVTTVGTPPSLTYNGPSEVNASPGTLNNINLSAAKGSGQFSAIGVEVNGAIADLAGLAFDGEAFTTNPQTISGANQDGFDMIPLTIRTPTEAGTYSYVITLFDEFGLSDMATVIFNVGTDLEVSMGSLLLNAAGGQGTGGLDLDTGNSVNSTDGSAEIRDQGINTDLPNDANWRRRIAPVNGAVIEYLRAGENNLSESFTFASIASKEILAGLVDNGVAFTGGQSDIVQVGDMFIVEANGNVYGLLVTAVTPTTNNNDDSYQFTIVK